MKLENNSSTALFILYTTMQLHLKDRTAQLTTIIRNKRK